MVFCTVFTFYLWNHKPLDVQTPIILHTDTTLAEILVKAGDQAREPYKLAPLDFFTSRPTPANFVAAWWLGLAPCFDGILFQINEKYRPVSTFPNSRMIPPRGYSFWSCLFRILLSEGYFALHFAGWKFALPTAVERTLWRAAMIYFIGPYTTYLIVFAVVTSLSGRIAKKYVQKEEGVCTFIDVASLLPRWFMLAGLLPLFYPRTSPTLSPHFVALSVRASRSRNAIFTVAHPAERL